MRRDHRSEPQRLLDEYRAMIAANLNGVDLTDWAHDFRQRYLDACEAVEDAMDVRDE